MTNSAPNANEDGSITLDNASVQRLMDYGLLHYTDAGWVVGKVWHYGCAPSRQRASTLADENAMLRKELEYFVDIMDGTDDTGFDPVVEQMLMDAAESARAALSEGGYETSGKSADHPRVSTALDMCAHGADKGSYCGYCGGYSKGANDAAR